MKDHNQNYTPKQDGEDRSEWSSPQTEKQAHRTEDYAAIRITPTQSSPAQHRHLILTYYVLRQTHTTNSFVIAHYANRPHNPPNITHVVFKWRKQGLTTRMNPGKPFTQKPLLGQYVRTKSNLLSGGLTPFHLRLTLAVGRWR